AAFSPCGLYRWWLERLWQPAAPRLIFIGLNPSRAGGQRDDPTLRRLVGFAQHWGFGSLEVVNLFARVSPSPAVLRRAADPVGAEADVWMQQRLAANPQALVWLGWGNQGAWRGRDQAVLALLQGRGLWALGLTAAGQPRHPLYVASDVALQPLTWRNQQTLGHPVGTSASLPGAPPCPASPAAMPFTCI
ncbi:MAG: DUF1643 domain-containing protein, partial [Cyanobium sp. MAG_137]|nr:DUF1643 domain-containing protein [Cyanobium sp. MAG_255]MDP4737369.1 DUF1643 domain-containing protein [Cyanobium sp. MAG_216]MDP4880714.1 DUF1643 domain-containing protein [Cyanobium sp. MAG_137]MDP4947003.1 DUF1643 domain-containing protein [Cyanobium sp. MAG_102]